MGAVAIVLGSGSAERFKQEGVPKHLTPILEVPIIVWTLKTILESKLFNSVIVVTRQSDLDQTREILSSYFAKDSTPFISLTEGADERSESFILGFKTLINSKQAHFDSVVALFDANRPHTSKNQLIELYREAFVHGCACPARSVINGIARAVSGQIISVPPKSEFVEFMTPEFLNLKAFDVSIEHFLRGHACLVEYSLSEGCYPRIIEATDFNAKLTYPEDKTYIEGVAICHDISIPKKVKI